ncbi:MAG: hypothetical protein PUD47_05135 [Bacteroidales bacterium]|nr:hypothetical protein [Bacteroidales bacterium]
MLFYESGHKDTTKKRDTKAGVKESGHEKNPRSKREQGFVGVEKVTATGFKPVTG